MNTQKTHTQLHRQVPERDDKPKSNAINDACFSPDGSNLIIAVENRVLVYDAAEGELLNSLRGHKDSVRQYRVSNTTWVQSVSMLPVFIVLLLRCRESCARSQGKPESLILIVWDPVLTYYIDQMRLQFSGVDVDIDVDVNVAVVVVGFTTHYVFLFPTLEQNRKTPPDVTG